jgi:valyl-tRNA synthetase
MICTFGDTTDVTWWRELALPTRPVIGWDGRLLPETPEWITTDEGRQAYEAIAGATAHTAKERMVERLTAAGVTDGDPRPTTQAVKYFEKGDKPLEIVTTRQWYLRNGGRDLELREELLARGRELHWHPDHMKVRYQHWVEGLNGDWLVSRQRFFGVPIPLWYRLDEHGNPDYDEPIVPDEASLPVDPSSDAPAGFSPDQRGVPGGFIGEPDVMDTWATSSLTPQISGGWERDPDLWSRVFPFDLRPQAHEIIRTWLFSSVVRAHLEDGCLPWSHVAISGWILDPDRKKMAKSKGNVVTPADLLAEHGSDAVRYWAASGRPGTDTAFDVGQMKIGRRLAIKLLNAAKFGLSLGAMTGASASDITEPLDRALLARLADVVAEATRAFDDYHYTRALEVTETFFWDFTDDYVELVKDRMYGGRGEAAQASARATVGVALDTLLDCSPPRCPLVTEEVWSWWQAGSVHRASWPEAAEVRTLAGDGDPAVLAVAGEVLSAVRKVKSEAQVSVRVEVPEAEVAVPAASMDAVRLVADDIAGAGRIASLTLVEGPGPGVTVTAQL